MEAPGKEGHEPFRRSGTGGLRWKNSKSCGAGVPLERGGAEGWMEGGEGKDEERKEKEGSEWS